MKIWETFTNQTQWELYIKNILNLNDLVLIRSVVTIYDSQTEEEKRLKESIVNNNVGFNKLDAKDLSRIAIKAKKGQFLSESEIKFLRCKMGKYWRQLMNASKKKMEKTMKEEQLTINSIIPKIEDEVIDEIKLNKEQNINKCKLDGISCDYGICSECKENVTF